MGTGLSIRAYAKHREEQGLTGASPWSVQKALKEGRIHKTADGKIDPVAADREWEQNTNPTMRRQAASTEATSSKNGSSNAPGITVPPLAQSRAIREAYQARLARLDYEERTGTLVSKEKVREAAFQRARTLRDRLLALPDRLASELAAITDPRELREVLDAELRQVVKELSRG